MILSVKELSDLATLHAEHDYEFLGERYVPDLLETVHAMRRMLVSLVSDDYDRFNEAELEDIRGLLRGTP